MEENERRKIADRTAWGVMFFLLAVMGVLITLGVILLTRAVL